MRGFPKLHKIQRMVEGNSDCVAWARLESLLLIFGDNTATQRMLRRAWELPKGMKHFLSMSLKVYFFKFLLLFRTLYCYIILWLPRIPKHIFFSIKLLLFMASFLKALLFFSWVMISLICIKDKVILLYLSNNPFLGIMMSLSLPAWLRAIYLEHLSCPFSDRTPCILLDTSSKTNTNMKEKCLSC